MADLTFHQELIRSGVQALAVVLGGGLSVVTGWLLLRRQERIKRHEELAAGMRRLRVDALVKALAAVGRFHSEASFLRGWQKAVPLNEAQQALWNEAFRRKEDATRAAVNALADTFFLLGEPVASIVRRRFSEMMQCQLDATDERADIAARALETDLSAWIPPLERYRKP